MARSKILAAKKRQKADPKVRRQAILDAGLAVFAAKGYAAARLDDVATRAGVAKGTIYLYFRDKEDLFEQIVRSAVEPVLVRLRALSEIPDVPTGELLAMLFDTFKAEIIETDRKQVIRLIMTEGPRFPEIAAFYHREVVSEFLAMMRQLMNRGASRGEVISPDLEAFPHLIIAPLLLALIWDGLFSKFDPLDVDGLLETHRKILTARPVRKP